MRKLVFTLLMLQTLTSLALAQPVGTIIKAGYSLEIYNVGSKTMLAQYYSDPLLVLCNLTITTFQDLSVNPVNLIFSDPVNTGKFCEWTSAGGIFANLPKGVPLELSISQVLEGGLQSDPSDRKAFQMNAPAKITGVRVGVKK